MLGDSNVSATVAVKDLAAARKFYEETLGLHEIITESDAVVIYKSGDSMIQIYASGFAGTNQATAATWSVSDIQAAAQELASKGVTFEHYEFPGVEHDGDVHIMGGELAAWFKDPDGNILCIHGD